MRRQWGWENVEESWQKKGTEDRDRKGKGKNKQKQRKKRIPWRRKNEMKSDKGKTGME